MYCIKFTQYNWSFNLFFFSFDFQKGDTTNQKCILVRCARSSLNYRFIIIDCICLLIPVKGVSVILIHEVDLVAYNMITSVLFSAFKCEFCEKAYGQNADLIKHLRTHVGENTYACNKCPDRFRLKFDLQKHYSVHVHYQTNPSI